MSDHARPLVALTLALSLFAPVGCGDPAAKPEPAKSGAAATTATATSSAGSVASAATATATTTGEPAPPASDTAVASATAAPSASGAKPVTAAGSAAASAAPSAVASAAPDVKGDEKSEASFTAFMSGGGKYKANQPGSVTAVVNALGDYHVNQEYPYKFALNAAPAGVTYGETVIRNVNRSEKKATISIPFTPTQAGTVTISGTLSLGVCTASNCVNQKVPLAVTVKVE